MRWGTFIWYNSKHNPDPVDLLVAWACVCFSSFFPRLLSLLCFLPWHFVAICAQVVWLAAFIFFSSTLPLLWAADVCGNTWNVHITLHSTTCFSLHECIKFRQYQLIDVSVLVKVSLATDLWSASTTHFILSSGQYYAWSALHWLGLLTKLLKSNKDPDALMQWIIQSFHWVWSAFMHWWSKCTWQVFRVLWGISD